MSGKRACVFCQIRDGKLPASVIYEDDTFLIFMDAYPLTSGHVLVVPKVHSQFLSGLSEQDQQSLFRLGNAVMTGMRKAGYGVDGCNVLLNDGKAANQTVPHVHLHIIPRKSRDILKSIPKLLLHITGLFGIQTRRELLDEQAKDIAQYCEFD